MAFDFGKRIQDLLDEKGKSQSDLARYLGVKASTVSQWSAGKANPTADKLEPIARFFRMSLPDLVSDIDPDQASSPSITVMNTSGDLQQIPFGSYIKVETGTDPDLGDIVLYKSGDKLRFLRLAAQKDGIMVLMSDIDGDPPVIATQDTEIIGTATAILLKSKEKEPASDGTDTDSSSNHTLNNKVNKDHLQDTTSAQESQP